MSALLSIQNVSKYYEGVRALHNVCLDIQAGQVCAIVGENGAGKSTLIKIICGVISHDGGTISIDGKVCKISNPLMAQNLGIRAVQQHFSLDASKTVAENLFMNDYPRTKIGTIDWKKMNRDAKVLLDEVGFSDVDPSAMVSDISVADCQRVEVTKAVRDEPRVLILDEPSAVLPENDVDKLFALIRKLKQKGAGIIYISHHMEEIFKIADCITVFKDGEVVTNYEDISNVTKYDLIEKMVGREITDIYPELNPCTDEIILDVRNLETKKIHDISFQLHRGEIIGLAGLVGAGRTEVCRALFGIDPILSGTIELEGKSYHPKRIRDAIRRGFGFVTEDRHFDGLILSSSVETNVTLVGIRKLLNGLIINRRRSRRTTQEFIEKLHIATSSMDKAVSKLSGGNQQKIVIAKWMFITPKIILLDEATRGIDVGAKREIYGLMNELIREGYSIIMVSSELLEVLQMSHRVFVMREGRMEAEYGYGQASEEEVIRVASGL